MENFNIADPGSFVKAQVYEVLRSIPDPELNVNILDLGLIYEVDVNQTDHSIRILMTLSSSHCPMGDAILKSVENAMEANFNNYVARVELTWEPVWNYDMITEEGLRQMGR